MLLFTFWRFIKRTVSSNWLSQVLTESKYYGPNTAAEAVSKIFKPEERPQKIILDIGAGTGLVAEEVTCIYCLVWCFWRRANMILVYCLHVPQKIVFFWDFYIHFRLLNKGWFNKSKSPFKRNLNVKCEKFKNF